MRNANGRRKVALVVPALREGGVPNVAEFLYRILVESGRYVPDLIFVATSADDGASVRLLSPRSWRRGVQVISGNWNGYPFSQVGAVLTEFEFQRYRQRPQLTDLLNRYDLVQIVSGSPQWALVATNYRGPLALQVATLTAVERKSSLARTPQPRRAWVKLMTSIGTYMEQSALRRADAIFVENQWMYELLCERFSQQKVLFAPPGVDTEYFRSDGYQKDSYILSVGRFSDPRKNVKLLLEAYSQVRKSLPNAPDLVLVGYTAPTEKDLSYAASLGLTDHVQILQAVTREKLRELYRHASLFVLPSDEEGLGLVVLEAMACGLPVLSTKSGGPETVIRPEVTGILTPVGDAKALAGGMQRLLQDRLLRVNMSREARRTAIERFSIRVTAKQFLNKYDQLLG